MLEDQAGTLSDVQQLQELATVSTDVMATAKKDKRYVWHLKIKRVKEKGLVQR